MAIPLIYAGVMLGRFAIPVIARYIIKNGAKKAAKKFGTKVVANAKVTKQIKQLKTITKTKPKVKITNTSAKQKNIAKKIAEKNQKKLDKVNPRKKIQAKKTTDTKLASPKTTKTKPSKTDLIKKVDKKVVTKKVDKKSLATKNKQDKLVAEQQKKYLLERTVRGKPIPKNKSLVTVKPKVKPKVKTKPSGSNLPIIVGGGLGLAGIFAAASKKNKKKAPNIPKGLTPPSILNPKPKTGTGRGEGSKETTRRRKDAVGSARKSSGPTTRPKLTMDRGNSFENRIRRLVSKKDALTKIPSGDGRSEYQVRIGKLKKENPKAFKKMFKLGGFGNLKD